MPKFDYDLLAANIKALLKKNKLIQENLAEVLDISQEQISKHLNSKRHDQLSIEQLYYISRYFDVSMDYLVTGKHTPNINSIRNVCEFLVNLFEEYSPEIVNFERIEEIISAPKKETHYEQVAHKDKVKYKALFFPNCWNHDRDKEYSEERLDCYSPFEMLEGNELPRNITINSFLEMFIPLHKSFLSGRIAEKEYRNAVNSIIETVVK